MIKKQNNSRIRDKERTKQKLINSIGKIVKSYGFNAIDVKTIEKISGVDKKMIYFHFGGVENLVNEFLRQNDYWEKLSGTGYDPDTLGSFGEKEIVSLLQNQLSHFYKSKESQGMILWELSESNKHLRKIANERESFGNKLFELTDDHFKGTEIDIRAINALLVGGIYYLVLHSRSNGSTFCGIDIRTKDGLERIQKSIAETIKLHYQKSKEADDFFRIQAVNTKKRC